MAVILKVGSGAQTSSLRLAGRVRISHPYICQTESAMAMRLCMTEHYWAQRMVPGPPNGNSQEGRGGAAGGERPRQSQGRKGTNSPER